jgi:hypothetical protein
MTPNTALDITLRTAVVYIVILVGLRLSGKREIGQITVFDLVVLLLLANAVQNAMVGPDTSLAGGILAAIVLLALSAIVIPLACGGLSCATCSRALRRSWCCTASRSPNIFVARGWTKTPWKQRCANMASAASVTSRWLFSRSTDPSVSFQPASKPNE